MPKIRYCNYILISLVLFVVSCLTVLMVLGPESAIKILPQLHNETKEISIQVAQNNLTTSDEETMNAFQFPIHLLSNAKLLSSSYLYSKGRTNVSIVMGVPTVERKKRSYLRSTLRNLIVNMNQEEQNEALIIVYIGETDFDAVQRITKKIKKSFEPYLESGLIDIIAPHPDYYPQEDAKWRNKQTLDIAYLMAYAHTKGTFYVQLADDILSLPQYVSAMKKFALIKLALDNPFEPNWFILDFCQYGLVGKLFKSAELPYLITYLQMFYNKMDTYKMFSYFIESTMCRINRKHCILEQYWQHYNISLFQHIGVFSLKKRLDKLIGKKDYIKVKLH